MKTSVTDPWSNGTQVSNDCETNGNEDARFEDSFVNERLDSSRLSDSEQYLARLYSRLKNVKGGTSKKDLIDSLSNAKEDCIARLVTNGQRFDSEEEAMLAANPVIRHIAPHLQALTASELVHLLKADVLQSVTDEQHGKEEPETEIPPPEKEPQTSDQSQTESQPEKCESKSSSIEENANEKE